MDQQVIDQNVRGIGMTSARTRDRLVQRLQESGIRSSEVLEQIRNVPRHLFVDEALASRAYEDTALPIGLGQTISQPYVVARMTEALLDGLDGGRILEIGTGCGYQTAVLAPLVKATGGSIDFDGTELTGLAAHRIPKLGIGYVPQGRRLFGELSVEENLRIGRLVRRTGQDTLDWVLDLFPILTQRMDQRSGSLSGGEQQMLAVARALCLEPKLLLMDDPQYVEAARALASRAMREGGTKPRDRARWACRAP